MIPQRSLSLLSNRLAVRGGRRVPEGVLERDYCLSWILVGLAYSPLRDRLAFKGGTALKKCYFEDYRFSEDLDFTLIEKTPWEELERGLTAAFEEARRRSGVEFRAKQTRLRKLWEVRLAPQMAELPAFDGVYRAVRRSLRQAGIPRR